jgi:hypothetical protein
MGKTVFFRGGKSFVKISKEDRKVFKRQNIKAPSKSIISVDKYAKLLERIK